MNYVSTETYNRMRDAGFQFPMPGGAPGAAEILRELGPEYRIGVQGDWFYCYRISDNHAKFDKNMAEAAAAAWLSIHENKNHNK